MVGTSSSDFSARAAPRKTMGVKLMWGLLYFDQSFEGFVRSFEQRKEVATSRRPEMVIFGVWTSSQFPETTL
jgi:hypothetical protein